MDRHQQLGDHVIRPTAVRLAGPTLAVVLVLAALAGPSVVLAADPDPAGPPADGTPTVVPHSTEAPTDGEIVYDGPFVDPTDDTGTDAGQPGGDTHAPARPGITPPATDALAGDAPAAAGGTFLLLLASLAAITGTALHAGRGGLARRP